MEVIRRPKSSKDGEGGRTESVLVKLSIMNSHGSKIDGFAWGLQGNTVLGNGRIGNWIIDRAFGYRKGVLLTPIQVP